MSTRAYFFNLSLILFVVADTVPLVLASIALKQLPIEAFGSLPDATQVQLSPDGEHVIALSQVQAPKEKGSAIHNRYFRKNELVPQIQTNIIDKMPDDPENFLLSLDKTKPGNPAVFQVSIEKSKMKLIQAPKLNVSWWVTDREHTVCIGIARVDTTYTAYHRFNKKERWKTLWEFEAFSKEQVWPLGFD